MSAIDMERDDEPPARTKMVASLGPATDAPGMIDAILRGGVDVVRLNFSHGNHQEHARRLAEVREASSRLGTPVAVLVDLQGGKIRIGAVGNDGIAHDLEHGDAFTITTAGWALGPTATTVSHPALADEVAVGDRVLLDDGRLQLRIEQIVGGELRCRVEIGGRLLAHKGLNVPGRPNTVPSLTDKDVQDAAWLAGREVDLVALSFVRDAHDVVRVRELLAPATPRLIAKIERVDALANIEAILAEADGIMVARGDLGLEIPIENLPVVQKDLVKLALAAGKPVIVATQMLESMTASPLPTRAEVADVANAILDGADAVMLSGETSIGYRPAAVVRMMNRIALRTEASRYRALRLEPSAGRNGLTAALAAAAATLADHLDGSVLVLDGGDPGLCRLAARWTTASCLAVCGDAATARRLALTWGVVPVLFDGCDFTTVRARSDLHSSLTSAAGIKDAARLIFAGRCCGVTLVELGE